MGKLDLKDECIHNFIYDLIYIYIYRERENVIAIVGLSEGTVGRQERKRE
jgi:hypothetical protein